MFATPISTQAATNAEILGSDAGSQYIKIPTTIAPSGTVAAIIGIKVLRLIAEYVIRAINATAKIRDPAATSEGISFVKPLVVGNKYILNTWAATESNNITEVKRKAIGYSRGFC